MADFEYVAVGGITLGGAADTDNTVAFTLESTWNVLGFIGAIRSFYWNVGQIPLSWYRIQGECLELGCVTTGIEPNDSSCSEDSSARYIQLIAARGLTDLCRQIKKNTFIWPVERIQRYSNPAYSNEGVTSECNELIDEEFCRHPECLGLCLSLDAEESIGATDSINVFYYSVGSGGITLGGKADIILPTYRYTGSGGITLGGASATNDLGVFVSEIGATSLIDEVFVEFIGEDETGFSVGNTSVITSCDCSPIPITLSMSFNLINNNLLSQFLSKNNIKIPHNILINYNNTDNVWRNILHYRGIGLSDEQEQWTLIFEWGCINSIAGIALGSNLWKLSLYIKQNLNNFDMETRILIHLPVSSECSSTSDLSIKFTINTLTSAIDTIPSFFVESPILMDEIGLFKNKYWRSNPNLLINLSEQTIETMIPRFDISPIFPNSPLLV